MNAHPTGGKFESTAQRVASSYARMLAAFQPVLPDGTDPAQETELTAAQADLHAFFEQMYAQLFADPAQFGLPLGEDVYIIDERSKEGPNKTDLKRQLDRPRKLIGEGLDFLMHMGLHARLEGGALVLDASAPQPALPGKKSGRAWLAGMQRAGLVLEQRDGLRLSSPQYPQMMAALQALAQACAASPVPELGQAFFARCDFRALRQNYHLEPLELYRIFSPEQCARAASLHAFFIGRGYQPEVSLNAKLGWSVKYQGKRSAKATPLFQFDFDDRLREPLRALIKCASVQRLAPLLASRSEALRDDFAARVFNCSDCGWCSNKKTLGPVEFVHHGQPRRVCWYVMSDVKDFNDEAVALAQEYALMHEALS